VSPAVLLGTAVGALGLAIATLVMAAAPTRSARGGIARAAAAIEQRYVQHDEASEDAAVLSAPRWLRSLGLRLSPAGGAAAVERRLAIAGNPRRWNSDRILAVKGFGLLALALLGGGYGLPSPVTALLFGGLGAAAGFYVPDLLVYNAGSKRQAKIQNSLPDAMDMLTVCVEAGLGFDSALARVAGSITGPLAAEFSRALKEIQIGKSRTQSLRALADRTTVAELRAFVTALIQAGELGIPIANVLREQAKEMRLRRRQRAEEKAQMVPVKILFPLIGCLFPALFIIIIGPGAIGIMNTMFGKH
jgi:tight adherence protein C